jgi:Nuclease-related domain
MKYGGNYRGLLGRRPDERSERDFLAQLKEDLVRRNISATILANFYTHGSSRQIDFLVVTRNRACQVELKSYSGVLVGGTNGPWSTRRPDGTLEVIERQNPYDQAVHCKMAISDDLQLLADQDRGIPRPARGKRFYTQLDSVVCIFPRLESGSQVPGDFKAQTLAYAEFLQLLTSPGAHPDWKPEHWLSYIRLLGLTNAAGPSVQALAATTAQELTSTYWQRFSNFYRHDLH